MGGSMKRRVLWFGHAARETRAELRNLTDAVLMYLASLDEAVARRKDIPRDISEWLGTNANKLDMVNDHARYFGLGVNRTDNKARALAAARKRATR